MAPGFFAISANPKWAESKLRFWPVDHGPLGGAPCSRKWVRRSFETHKRAAVRRVGDPKRLARRRHQLICARSKSASEFVLFGLLLSIPLISVADREIDQHWPQVEEDLRAEAPVLFIEFPFDVDTSQIALMLQRFGRKWEAATIRWPLSSQRLLDEAERILKSSHKLDLSDAEIMSAFGTLQEKIRRASGLRSNFEFLIPASRRQVRIV